MFKEDFPQLKRKGIYLDSAATALKPKALIDATTDYYSNDVSNIHRGVHGLAVSGTHQYEGGRAAVANFIGAKSNEIIFTSGTTDGINLVSTMIKKELSEHDNIVLSIAEHHSNILPWQNLGVELRYVKVNSDGIVDLNDLEKKVDSKTKVVSLFHLSNVLGTVNPLTEISKLVRGKTDGYILYDAAQSFAHMFLDMEKIDCDFLVFSAHKAYGPNGLGVLYIKEGMKIFPARVGGGMVTDVSLKEATYVEPPNYYEAGTPNMAGVISFSKMLPNLKRYIENHHQEDVLIDKLRNRLNEQPGISFIAPRSKSLLSFNIDGAHSGDFGQLLSEQNIYVRTGSHCCIPLMKKLGVAGTIRVSVGVYNDESDIDLFIEALYKARKILGV